jgi:hypothetical protein
MAFFNFVTNNGTLLLAIFVFIFGSVAASQHREDAASLDTTPKKKRQPPSFETMWELISWYSQDYDMDGLHDHLRGIFVPSERNRDPNQIKSKLLPGFAKRGAGLTYTTRHKLAHDIEQSLYLSQQGEELGEAFTTLFGNVLPRIYQSVLDKISPGKDEFFYPFDPDDLQQR